jgi:hypothetical protein
VLVAEHRLERQQVCALVVDRKDIRFSEHVHRG